MRLVIELPWPPKECNPNSRAHWAKAAKAKASYRDACFFETRRQIGSSLPAREGYSLWITFYAPDRRRRDDDNVLASFKSGRDGIASALGVDDSKFRQLPYLHTETRKGGLVKVVITEQADDLPWSYEESEE